MLLDKSNTCSKVSNFFPGCETFSPKKCHFVVIAPSVGCELFSFALDKWSTKIGSYFIKTICYLEERI